MANDAFVVHGMVMLKPQVPTEKVGETMFWKRKKDGAEEGNPCPFCGAQNEHDATTCMQCYYDLNKPARDQHLEVASDVQNDLLSTLMDSDENEDEEEFVVEAVLDLEDVTIQVDQYDDPVSSEGFSFIDSEGPTLSETVEFETREEVELTTEDAPDIEERFELPDANPLDEVEEPVHTGQGQLIQTDDDENDVDFTGTVGPDPNAIPELPETEEDLPLPPAGELTIPDIPDDLEEDEPQVPELPEEETVPELPEESETLELPEDDAVPELPEDDDLESTIEQPAKEDVVAPDVPTSTRIWPWPAGEPMDPREVHRIVVESLGLVRAGRIAEAEHNIDALGPRLGDDVSLLYHIGLILQQAGRAEHLNWMLEMARRVHPNDENVMNAITHLSA